MIRILVLLAQFISLKRNYSLHIEKLSNTADYYQILVQLKY